MKITELRVDGYKNLSECVIPLRDFNVVVGPNNSGKSNLLETFSVLWALCFGPEEYRREFFQGFPFRHGARAMPSFGRPEQATLSIGFSYETTVAGVLWCVDYDMSIRRGMEQPGSRGFVTETLKGKQRSKTGPARTYVAREKETLRIDEKNHRISRDTSALTAISVLYPESNGLPDELSQFAKEILSVARTRVYALSPEALRANLHGDSESPGPRTSWFSILPALDEIYKLPQKRTEFREAVLNILDLDDLFFRAQDMELPNGKAQEGKRTQRFRFCAIQRKCGDWAEISEYSDGTLIVVALVAALVLDDPTDRFTCIEELENCLHPSAQEKLLRFLIDNSKRWRVLVTTHSPYVLNGVNPLDVVVAVVGKTGASHFEKTTDFKKIRELLKSGLLSFGDLMATNFKEVLE